MKKMTVLHFSARGPDGYLTHALCGRESAMSRLANYGGTPPEKYVTCKRCLRKLRETTSLKEPKR